MFQLMDVGISMKILNVELESIGPWQNPQLFSPEAGLNFLINNPEINP